MLIINPFALGLSVVKMNSTEVLALCPYHHDNHPSASFNVTTGLFHCFACGASANKDKLAAYLGGIIEYVEQRDIKTKAESPEIHWILAQPLAYGNEYLASRGINDSLVERYAIRQVGDYAIGFELYDSRSQLIGVQLRIYSQKWLKFLPKYMLIGQKPVVWPLVNLRHRAYIVEGIFGVLKAESYGFSAVATMGAGIRRETIAALSPFRDMRVVFDGDYAGLFGAMKLVYSVDSCAVIPPVEADRICWDSELPSDCTRNINLIARMSVQSDKLKRQFNQWKER